MKRFRLLPKLLQLQLRHRHSMWGDVALMVASIAFVIALAVVAIVWVANPAPPKSITMSAGSQDSAFLQTAEEYRKILARNGVTLNVLESEGSVQNLQRLLDPKGQVDVALVQGGVSDGFAVSKLVSLGSVFYIPSVIFYRGKGLTQLLQLEGKKIAVGREGSGTRKLTLKLFAANGIEPSGATTFLPLDGRQAATELAAGRIDAAVFSGDSATRALMLKLYRTPGISLLDFRDASTYTRLFPYLDEIDLPAGVLDLRHRIPPDTVRLISPTVEIVARSNLHPAISDLIIEAAQEVHSMPGLLQRAGQFPNPTEREYPMSKDAARYYKSGKSFLYRTMPFWVASIADRLLVVILPIAFLVFPVLRLIPAIYSWRVKSRLYRYYGALIAIERRAPDHASVGDGQALLRELDEIEESLNTLRMPLAYTDAFYVLREHIGLVRAHLGEAARERVSR